ncbi:WD40-repeat-containing domain protein [Dichomitus squalens]|uniref:WD40-repeat-containing domain protein n=1 Tax=Dichomitus squalens TaxID=114155 RepID=A0A4Q9Q3W9_9APHY|nr:WD40-repeat-containing domain protein [Dichomitus squalens]
MPTKLSIHRKFVFALKGDVYLHYNPFATPDDLRKQVCAYNYTSFGIGPVYSTELHAAAFAPGSARLATACSDDIVRIWYVETGKPIVVLEHTGGAQDLEFSPDGSLLLSASWTWTVKIWDAYTGVMIMSLEGHSFPVTTARFSPCGRDRRRLWGALGNETVGADADRLRPISGAVDGGTELCVSSKYPPAVFPFDTPGPTLDRLRRSSSLQQTGAISSSFLATCGTGAVPLSLMHMGSLTQSM